MKQFYIDNILDKEKQSHSLNLLLSEFTKTPQDDEIDESNVKCSFYDTNKFRAMCFYKQITRPICDFTKLKIHE